MDRIAAVSGRPAESLHKGIPTHDHLPVAQGMSPNRGASSTTKGSGSSTSSTRKHSSTSSWTTPRLAGP